MDQPSGIFSTLRTAEVGPLEEMHNISGREECPHHRALPFCSVGGPKTVTLPGHVCPYTIQEFVPDRSHGGESQPQEVGETLALTWGRLLSSASSRGGGRWRTPAGNYKRLLANGIKKYQNISKNFKNCQAWRTHRAGSLSTRRAALHFRGLSWRRGLRPLSR